MADDEVFGGGEDVSIVIGVHDESVNRAFNNAEARIQKIQRMRPTVTVKAQFDDSEIKNHFAKYTALSGGLAGMATRRDPQRDISHYSRVGAYNPGKAAEEYVKQTHAMWRQIDKEQAAEDTRRINNLRNNIAQRSNWYGKMRSNSDSYSRQIEGWRTGQNDHQTSKFYTGQWLNRPENREAARAAETARTRAGMEARAVATNMQAAAHIRNNVPDYAARIRANGALKNFSMLPAGTSSPMNWDDGQMAQAATNNFGQTWRSRVLPAIASFSVRTAQDIERQVQMLQGEARRHYFTGQTLSSTFTIPAAAAAVGSIYMGGQLNERMHKISALTETRPEEIPGLTKQIVGLSTKLPQSAIELSDAMYEVNSANHKGQEGFRVMEQSAKGAAAGLGETKDVADFLTGALAAYNMTADKATHVTDVLTKAVNLGKGEANQYAPAIGKVVGQASMLGVSLEQVVASMATMSRINIKPDTAATSLNQLLMNLSAPSDRAKKTLGKLDLTPQMVRAQLKDDSKGGMAGFLQRLVSNPKVGIEEIEDLVGNARALRAALATAGAQAEVYKSILHGVNNAHGETDRALNEMSKGFNFQWGRMLNVGKKAIYDISEKWMPSLTEKIKSAADTIPIYIAKISAAWGDLGSIPGAQGALAVGAGALVAGGPLFHMLAVWKDVKAGLLQFGGFVGKNPFTWVGAAAIAMTALSGSTGKLGDMATGVTDAFSNWGGPLDKSSMALNGILLTLTSIQALRMAPAINSFVAAQAARVSALSSAGSSMLGSAAVVGGGSAAKGLWRMGRNFLKTGAAAGQMATADGLAYTVLGGRAAAGAMSYGGVGSLGTVGAGYVASPILASGAAWGGAAYYQEYQRRNAEIEGQQYELKSRNIGVDRSLTQAYSMAAGNEGALGAVEKIHSSVAAAGEDVLGLDRALRKITEGKNDIKQLRLSPFAEKMMLSQFDEIYRQVESKKLIITAEVKTSWEGFKEDLNSQLIQPLQAGTSYVGNLISGPLNNLFSKSTDTTGYVPVLSDADKRKQEFADFMAPMARRAANNQKPAVFTAPAPPEPKIDYNDYNSVKAGLNYFSKYGKDDNSTRSKWGKLTASRASMEAKAANNGLGDRAGLGGDGSGSGPTEAERQATDAKVKGIQSQQDALKKLMSAYGAYEGSIDSVLGKVREFTIRTEEARISNEMHKRALDGVSDSYKAQAISVASLADRMQRIVGMKDLLKNYYAGLQQSVMASGGDLNALNPFIKQSAKDLDFKNRMSSLQDEALGKGGALSQAAQTEQDKLQQSINNLAASIDGLRAALTGQPATATAPSSNGTAPPPNGSEVRNLKPFSVSQLKKEALYKRAAKIAPVTIKGAAVNEDDRKLSRTTLDRSEYDLSSFNTNYNSFLSRDVTPSTLDSANQMRLRNLLASTTAQEAMVDYAKAIGFSEAQTDQIRHRQPGVIQKIVRLMEQAAIEADRVNKSEAARAQYSEMHVSRARERNRILADGDSIEEMTLEANRPGGDYRNFTDEQWFNTVQGQRSLLSLGYSSDDKSRGRAHSSEMGALWQGDQYLNSAGLAATTEKYNRAIEYARKKAEVAESVRVRFKGDDLGKSMYVESEMKRFRDTRDSGLIAQAKLDHAARMTGFSDQSLTSNLKMGLLRGGTRPEMADIEAQVDAAKREAMRGYTEKNDPGAAGKANAEAEALRKSLVESMGTGELSRFSEDLLGLSRALKSVGDDTGYFAKKLELLDMKSILPAEVDDYMSKYSDLQFEQVKLSGARRIAGVGARNEAESLQADYDVWMRDVAPGKSSDVINDYQRSQQAKIQAAKIYEPKELSVNMIRAGRERLDQQKLEFDTMRAVTDEQKADLIVQQAKLDAKYKGLALDEATLEVIKQQALEQVKNEESLNRQSQMMSATENGFKKLMEGDLKGGIAGTIHEMADNLRSEMAHILNQYAWGKLGKKGKEGQDGTTTSAGGSVLGGVLGAVLGGEDSTKGAYDMAVQLVRMQANTVEITAGTVNVGQGAAGGVGSLISGGKRGMSSSQFAMSAISIFAGRR